MAKASTRPADPQQAVAFVIAVAKLALVGVVQGIADAPSEVRVARRDAHAFAVGGNSHDALQGVRALLRSLAVAGAREDLVAVLREEATAQRHRRGRKTIAYAQAGGAARRQCAARCAARCGLPTPAAAAVHRAAIR